MARRCSCWTALARPAAGRGNQAADGGRPRSTSASLPAANATQRARGQRDHHRFALAFLLTRHYPARALALGSRACALLAAPPPVPAAALASDVIGAGRSALAWVLLVLRWPARTWRRNRRPLVIPAPRRRIMENRRTETARQTDDSELIESMEEAPSFGSASGGQLQARHRQPRRNRA
jgi:hypothetical protein